MRRLPLFIWLLVAVSRPAAAQAWAWEAAIGPNGGSVILNTVEEDLAFAMNISVPDTFWRSTDGGQSWQWVQDVMRDLPGIVVRTPSGALLGDAIWRSTDDGITWEPTSSPFGASDYLIVHGERIYAVRDGDGTHVFASTDDGHTWSEVGAAADLDYVYEFVVGPAGRLWMAGRGGAFFSTDEGTTWHPAHPHVTGAGVVSTVQALAVTDRGVYALCRGRLYEFSDPTLGDRRAPLAWKSVRHFNGQPDALAIGDGGRIVYVGSNAVVYRSLDAGRTWEPSSVGSDNVYDIDIVEAGVALATVRDQGVWRSSDHGRTWGPTGVPGCRVSNFATYADGAGLVTGCENLTAVYHSRDGGRRWERFGPPFHGIGSAKVGATEAGTVFRERYPGGRVYRSIDGGALWEEVFDGDPSSFVQVPNGPFYVFLPDGWHRTTDEGDTWASGPVPGDVRSAVALEDGSIIVLTDDSVYRTEDGGLQWMPAANGLPRAPDRIAADAAGTMYVPLPEGLFRSSDRGRSWVGLGFLNSYSSPPIAAGPPGVVVTTKDGGVYFSTDEGETWTFGAEAIFRSDFPRIYVNSLFVTAAGAVVAGTYGTGVLTGTLPQLAETAMAMGSEGASPFALSAHPNPSLSGSGRISLHLTSAADTRVVLYDALGREVAVLLDRPIGTGGRIEVPLPSWLPAGVYVVRASGGGSSEWLKAVVAR